MENEIEKQLEKEVHLIEKGAHDFKKIFLFLSVVLLLVSLVNLFFISQVGSASKIKLAEAKEAARPSQIEVVSIKSSSCIDCFDLSPAIQALKTLNITKQEELLMDSERAKELIKKYSIEKIPALILTGEINRTALSGFDNVDDALIFNGIKPLYVDVKTAQVKGRVSITIINDSSCKECLSLLPIITSLGQAGVKVTDLKYQDYTSTEGKNTISQFALKRIPVMLISKEIDSYPEIKISLMQLNATEKNSYYLLDLGMPPYKDLGTGSVVGLVDLILLTDSSCSECYDSSLNTQVLERFGIKIKNENKYDSNSQEGKALIAKYKIEKVPTMLISPEIKFYSSLVRVWPDVGTTENDGWFVLRKPEVLGISKNLNTNETIQKQG